ncbi:MAG: hypothetical protein ACM368_15545 [Gemmatimonadota bacterium]
MTNPFKDKNLVRGAWYVAALLAAAACGGKSAENQQPTPAPTQPLPLAGLASVKVPVLPLTLLAFDDSLPWASSFADRRAALGIADSILGTLLQGRGPEVTWILPEELRRQARRSPTFAANPDQMGTAILRGAKVGDFLPDPLRSELRALVAIADARHALVPAQLVYRRMAGAADGRMGTAELTVVIVDARLGQVGFKTVARGDGTDPWTALTRAVKALTPGLP